MGLKSQFQIEMKQREKRRKKRRQLTAKSQNVADYYYGKFYLKTKSQ